MGKYRKKPVVIEAMLVPPEGHEGSPELVAFLSECECQSEFDGSISIFTLEGTMSARPGDWIIKGVNGEFYPCKPDVFDKTYEPA